MNLFAILKVAVYHHGCFGIFDEQQAACDAAKAIADADVDDHHEYIVVPFVLNAPIPNPRYGAPDYQVLATYRKGK